MHAEKKQNNELIVNSLLMSSSTNSESLPLAPRFLLRPNQLTDTQFHFLIHKVAVKGAIEKFHLQRFLVEFLVETKVMFICYFLYVTRLRSQLFSRHYYKDKDQDYISDVKSVVSIFLTVWTEMQL